MEISRKQQFTRAWKETGWATIFCHDVAVAIITLLLAWALLPEPEAMSEAASILLTVAAACVVWPCLLLSWNYFRAPYLIAADRVDALEDRLSRAAHHEQNLIERDVWLLDAVYFVAFGKWEIPDNLPPEPELSAINRALNEVRQWALDGQLTIWGKARENEPWQKIQPEYWKDFSLDILEALRGNPEYFGTQLATIGFANSADMVALMTCRAQVEKNVAR